MATAGIQISNFERLLTRLKGQYLKNHSCREELDLISIKFYYYFWSPQKKIFLNPRSSVQRGFIEIFE
jgi:hypothetical protein